jgi:hypothetical protein
MRTICKCPQNGTSLVSYKELAWILHSIGLIPVAPVIAMMRFAIVVFGAKDCHTALIYSVVYGSGNNGYIRLSDGKMMLIIRRLADLYKLIHIYIHKYCKYCTALTKFIKWIGRSHDTKTRKSVRMRRVLSFLSYGARCHRCRAQLTYKDSRVRLRCYSSETATKSPKFPAQIPTEGHVELTPIRSLLALHGPDAAKFLQGLVTKIFPSQTEPKGMFTAFLSPPVAHFNAQQLTFLGTSTF